MTGMQEGPRGSESPFHAVPEREWVASNALAFAVRDRFPVSPGHTLVVTRRLVTDWWSATAEEQRAVLDLVDRVREELDRGHPRPDGYNVGFNSGAASIISRSSWALSSPTSCSKLSNTINICRERKAASNCWR